MSIRNSFAWRGPAGAALSAGLFLAAASGPVLAQSRVRTEPAFPDPPGYVLLRCDLHNHTVFSDGKVWPTVRIEEAWGQGLDALAFTDHLEYTPLTNDVPANYGRAYALAKPSGDALQLLVVSGGEITRGEPPGHWNALFLSDVGALKQVEYRDAVAAAMAQGAFVSWNHPGWQQPGGKSVWYAEQQEMLSKGWLHGIEIVNGNGYDPLAHQWCLEKQLTMLGNSDLHGPSAMEYDDTATGHRPMTLVLAKARTIAALREALFARRTVVYWKNTLIGEAQYLRPIFEQSIRIVSPVPALRGRERALVQIHNTAAVSFELVQAGAPAAVIGPARLTLPAGKTVPVSIRLASAQAKGSSALTLAYVVENLKVTPTNGLPVELPLGSAK